MSASYDRPTGPPTPQPTRARLEHDPYGVPPTGPPALTTGRPRLAHAPKELGQPERPSRGRRTDAAPASAPIVPAGSVTGRSLTLVITIMCFLACLTAGAVYMMNQSASAWLRDIASEVTVQIEAKERSDVDKLVAEVTGYISRQ